MLDFDTSKLLVWGLIALVVIGPKDLPKVMRVAGYWLGKARAMSSQFRAGFDQMVREAELAEMEKKWAAENARIMAAQPAAPPAVLHGPDSAADPAGHVPPAPPPE
jgi:sec-independent protein translocase protein TatB